MAESLPSTSASFTPPPRKRAKSSVPAKKVSAEGRAEQFDDLYSDGGVLFCRYCCHSVDFVRVDTIKDHLKSKKHLEKKGGQSSKGARQVCLTSIVKSKSMREEFILDYIKLCSLAEIPLEKTEKMRPFFTKHCKQGGALPKDKFLRSEYVPRLFEQHYLALKTLVAEGCISIVADETTDVRDHSILNVIAMVREKSFLIGVEKMSACNHATFSQAIIKCVTEVGIKYEQVIAIVSDSAAYCKKAFRDVLSAIFPNAIHVRCLAHIVNLASEVFRQHSYFQHTAELISWIKSSLFKKPGRKARFLKFLSDYIPASEAKLPPEPVATRWNSWFAAAVYHSSRIHLYEGFYKAERGIINLNYLRLENTYINNCVCYIQVKEWLWNASLNW